MKSEGVLEAHKGAIYRRVTRRLMPFLMLCYVVAYLDRINIGFAKSSMELDLGFSDAVYGLGAGLFFIAYFFFEVPSNMLMHRIGARATISRIMILWGIVSGCTALVTQEWQFYLLRLLLGAAEAGFYPGILLLLTYWFPAQRRAKAVAFFVIAIPLSGVLGGPVSGLVIGSTHTLLNLANWQWLFIIEAIPSIVLGVIAYYYLDNRPREAKWLTDAEAGVIEADLRADADKAGSVSGKTVTSFLGTFRNKWVALLSLLVLCQALGIYGLSFWLPTLVTGVGITGPIAIGLFSAIPFGLAIVSIVLTGRNSDRLTERRWHLVVPFTVAAVGLTLSALLTGRPVLGIVAISLAAIGCYTTTSQVWTVVPAFMTGVGAAAGIAVVNSIGNLGGFLAPYFVGATSSATGSPAVGLIGIAGTLLLGAALTLVLPRDRVNR
ncbi:MFS transporter [Amycolatopsis ultiminotia]